MDDDACPRLNLNDPHSVLGAIQDTRTELAQMRRGVWPSASNVPERSRESYRRTLEAQEKYLTERLERLGKQDRARSAQPKR